MNAVIPIIKMNAMVKMKTNALSTPSAMFDAPPVNIIILIYLNK